MVLSVKLADVRVRKGEQKKAPEEAGPGSAFTFGSVIVLSGIWGALPYFAAVDQIQLPAETAQALQALYRQREENSRNFFRDNAGKFREQQDLIASYEQYAGTVAEVLRDAPIPRHDTALEVGPGDGSFLLQLAPRFQQVVALDNAATMLEQARATAARAGLDNVRFIHGDTSASELGELQAILKSCLDRVSELRERRRLEPASS